MIATPRHPDGTANTARILGAGTPRPPLPPATRPLTKEDEYNFDVGGYLVLPKVLSDAELAAANAAFDAGAFAAAPPSGWDPVTGVHIDEPGPLAALTSHPVLTGTLIQLFWSEETGDMRHGAQYKLETAPTVLQPLDPTAPSAPPPLEGGTAADGTLDTSRFYFNEAGHRFCHGVKVLVALAPAPAEAGGYVIVAGSRASTLPPPQASGCAD